MANIYQIGSGMVGSVMALDLAKDHSVFLADNDEKTLNIISSINPNIKTTFLDANNHSALNRFIQPADIVLLAVPGFLGYKALETIIKANKNVVDISFSPENTLSLDSIAKDHNVVAIVDAGVAPGIPNYLLGYYNSKLKIESFKYYVGGLPKNPKPPFLYKAPFSPIDVIEEYTRPARIKINGKIIKKDAVSECEILKFDNVGELEAFNTDGLRSLLYTMPQIPNLKEKTLRYPGHAKIIKEYKKNGKFEADKIQDTMKLLFNEWKLEAGEPEFTVMDIYIKGETELIHYHLYDEYKIDTNSSSMSRTTGYTATASINLILNNIYKSPGVSPPEMVGSQKGAWDFVKNYLEQRDVNIIKK